MKMRTDSPSAAVIWLISQSEDNAQSWIIHPVEPDSSTHAAGPDTWQVARTPSGLDRLRNKWTQAGKPGVLLKLPHPATLTPTSAHATDTARWIVCAPGHPLHLNAWNSDRRSTDDCRLLKQIGIVACPVIEVSGTEKTEMKWLRLVHLVAGRSLPPASRKWLQWIPDHRYLVTAFALLAYGWSQPEWLLMTTHAGGTQPQANTLTELHTLSLAVRNQCERRTSSNPEQKELSDGNTEQ